jgi:hypothetical protein
VGGRGNQPAGHVHTRTLTYVATLHVLEHVPTCHKHMYADSWHVQTLVICGTVHAFTSCSRHGSSQLSGSELPGRLLSKVMV